mmetsp:Transcript_4592/g.6980  ORF Transcript_4592/g.6980 Transcript_4592/m.6980 type:complete len:119 (+) Transcript_4592:278-634(+)
MTQTFNMSILNNSFNQAKPMHTMGNTSPYATNDPTSPFAGSPRGIRSLATETFAPFTIIPNAKIPDLSESRKEDREERVQNLLRRPRHKEGFRGPGSEINLSQSDKLMSAPLTMEDKT